MVQHFHHQRILREHAINMYPCRAVCGGGLTLTSRIILIGVGMTTRGFIRFTREGGGISYELG